MVKSMHCLKALWFFGFIGLLGVAQYVSSAPPVPIHHNPFRASMKAVPFKVEGDTVLVVKSFDRPVTITAAPGFQLYHWNHPSSFKATKSKNVLTIQSAPEGTHTVSVSAASFKYNKEKDEVEVTEESEDIVLNVGKLPAPTPPGPNPPGPNPPPTPTPGDPPIEGDGLRILILEESADRAKLPLTQKLILLAQPIRDFMNEKCASETSDGKRKGWNIWDKDVDMAAQPDRWKNAVSRANKKASEWKPSRGADGKPVGASSAYPWLLISNGKSGFEGPLPSTAGEFMELVKKFAPVSKSHSSKELSK